MTLEEVDRFLAEERTCRVATVGGEGQPHVAPLWFVWDGATLWLHSLVRSQRWADLGRNPRVAAGARRLVCSSAARALARPESRSLPGRETHRDRRPDGGHFIARRSEPWPN